MRTTIVIVLSCVLGVFIGFAVAKSALTINAWNPELEYKKHEELVREIAARMFNENAKVSVSETLYDFGIKDVQEKGQHVFSVTNVGTAPLTLEVNQLTCTCTGIEPSRQTIAPGRTGNLTVKWDAERATGFFKQGGTVVTNDQSYPEITFSIQGIFTPPIMLSPSSVAFPSISPTETYSSKIRIYGFERATLEILAAEWNNKEHFDFKIEPSELDETEKENAIHRNARSVFEGTVTVKPGLPIGFFQEKFLIRTNSVGEPNVEIIVRGQVYSSGIAITGMGFNKESGVILLGKTNTGQRLARDLTITFSGSTASQADLKVKEVKPDWLKVSLTEPRELGAESSRRRFYSLTVEVPAGSPVGNYFKADQDSTAMVVLDTGLTETPTLRIPVQFAVEQ